MTNLNLSASIMALMTADPPTHTHTHTHTTTTTIISSAGMLHSRTKNQEPTDWSTKEHDENHAPSTPTGGCAASYGTALQYCPYCHSASTDPREVTRRVSLGRTPLGPFSTAGTDHVAPSSGDVVAQMAPPSPARNTVYLTTRVGGHIERVH